MSDTDPYAPNVVYLPVEEPVVEAAEIAEPSNTEDVVFEETQDVVPVGTIADIIKWVGEDSGRAALALVAEEAGQGRKSLVKLLKTLV